MVLWIGVDDTDSVRGMCTTFLATELVRELTREYDLIGFPRLVRLNPNIPWKTRGNGAICVRIGRGSGPRRIVATIDGREVLSHQRCVGTPDPAPVEEIVAAVVERWSCFDDPRTHPGYVILRAPPSSGLYWKAVRGIVEKADAVKEIAGLGVHRSYKDGRGIIGAAAATSWHPRDRTFEILAYRSRQLWGTPRTIDARSVVEVDARFPSTFNNYDHMNRRVVLAPHSPCPVLLGIRGDLPDDLRPALEGIRGERPDRWMIFETNQGTDDHVHPHPVLLPRRAFRMSGTVSSRPHTLRGGHVVIRIGNMEVTAYEPSKELRAVVRALLPGDRVEVVGSLRESPQTLNLEKIRIDGLVPLVQKLANPFCWKCQRRGKSLGQGAGFRCPECGRKFPGSAAQYKSIERRIPLGWHEPAAGARRHLSKPAKRIATMSLAGRPERGIPEVTRTILSR